MKKILTILALSLLITPIHAEESTPSKSESNSTVKEQKFSLKTADEQTLEVKEIPSGLEFESFKGKVVMLSFIAYNGNPCLRAIDAFKSMQEKHKDIEVVAVEVRGLKQEGLQKFAKEKQIEFPLIAYDNAKDFTDYIANRARWNGSLPFTLIMDSKGLVRYFQVGLIPLEGLEKIYKQL